MSPRWEDVSKTVASAALSATGKRALFESRGEIFTVPTEKGDARNLTRSSGAADRAPVWSPDGKQIAWFSDSGSGYRLLIPRMFAALLLLSLAGIVIYGSLALISHLLLRRWHESALGKES